ncbi:syndecan-3-like [Stegastes partitus]|uniref:Syndecan-3-like n=1 Tax=Stegastes partitus TaxID=144197 RepID=A0A9Y4K585_9TELE|nr:PREDICTED: syndecan-3-like [Stegastes partitus]
MRGSVAAAVFLCVGLIPAVTRSHSALPEDWEGSGYDLDGSGSGSGDGSEQDEDIKVQPSSHEGKLLKSGGGSRNTLHSSSDLTFDGTAWPAGDDESGFVIMASSKRFWENEDILAAVIAAGVTGAIIAAALSAMLIYKRQKKDGEGHILGRRRESDEDYHKPIRDAVVI